MLLCLYIIQGASPMQNAEKISITMTPQMMNTIRACVESGEYASTSEVLRDAMRVWQRERIERAEHLESIKTRIKKSVEDPRPRQPLSEVKKRLSALHDETVKGQLHKAS
jgi:antitoxin ParD1/3/4